MPGRKPKRTRAMAVFDSELPVYDCVMVDVNTQNDFLTAEGVLPVVDATGVAERIKSIIDWTKRHHLPMVSLIDSHRPIDKSVRVSLFNCIDGTAGQQKLAFTLLPKRCMIDHDSSPGLPDDLLETYRQIILTKHTNDPFTNPKADRFFSRLQAKRLIIFGVGTERAIKSLLLGLLSRGKCPIVIRDACGHWESEPAELALRQAEAKGAMVMDTAQLIATPPDDLPVPEIVYKED